MAVAPDANGDNAGHWGCGAYGGSRPLMAMLQVCTLAHYSSTYLSIRPKS